jgi:hypothetical protein
MLTRERHANFLNPHLLVFIECRLLDAAAACTTPFDLFTNQNELAELIAGWPDVLRSSWNPPCLITRRRRLSRKNLWVSETLI